MQNRESNEGYSNSKLNFKSGISRQVLTSLLRHHKYNSTNELHCVAFIHKLFIIHCRVRLLNVLYDLTACGQTVYGAILESEGSLV